MWFQGLKVTNSRKRNISTNDTAYKCLFLFSNNLTFTECFKYDKDFYFSSHLWVNGLPDVPSSPNYLKSIFYKGILSQIQSLKPGD